MSICADFIKEEYGIKGLLLANNAIRFASDFLLDKNTSGCKECQTTEDEMNCSKCKKDNDLISEFTQYFWSQDQIIRSYIENHIRDIPNVQEYYDNLEHQEHFENIEHLDYYDNNLI